MSVFLVLALALALATFFLARHIARRRGARGTPAAIALSTGYFLAVLQLARLLLGQGA